MTEPIETTRGIDTLAPHPRNYNQHPPEQLERLSASLRQFGQVRPIVVHRDTIIAGHGVYLVAQHLGYSTLRVTQLPDDWTEEQALAYLVADNETRRGAESDDAGLAALLDELQQADFDLNSLGFDEQEYSALLDGLTPDLPEPGSGGDEFEHDDAAPCRVQPGDVWLIGGMHRLICGDCTDPATVERLMQGERADMVFTDPPYGVGYADKNRYLNAVGRGNRIQVPIVSDHDDIETTAAMWKLAFTTLHDAMKPGAVFYVCAPQGGDQMMMMMMMAAVLPVRHELMWLKNNHVLGRADYAYKHEPLLYGWRRDGSHYYGGGFQTSVWEIDKPLKSELHPTMKPVELVERAINNSSRDNGLIIDWFLGSGTTIIAAHRTGRRCYGCEISEAYCEVILQRCEAEGLSVERVEQG
jgi:DNA modification methylase